MNYDPSTIPITMEPMSDAQYMKYKMGYGTNYQANFMWFSIFLVVLFLVVVIWTVNATNKNITKNKKVTV